MVEEGPWAGEVEDQLRRIQRRLYDCVDAAIDGQIAAQFPASKGGRIVVQLDCYNVPRAQVEPFFVRFSEGILGIDQYRNALADSPFIDGLGFAINFDAVH